MLTKIEMQYMEAVVAINRRMRDHEIDWEQRRYEIAKDVMANSTLEQAVDYFLVGAAEAGDKNRAEQMAKTAVHLADALIAELKKESKQ